MSSTNKTTNYNLSQFVGTDIPSILNDYNGDMQAIDTAVHNVAVAEGDNASDIAGLQSTVSGHTSQITQVDSNVTALSGRVLTVEGKVTELDNKKGRLLLAIPRNTYNDNASWCNALKTAITNAGIDLYDETYDGESARLMIQWNGMLFKWIGGYDFNRVINTVESLSSRTDYNIYSTTININNNTNTILNTEVTHVIPTDVSETDYIEMTHNTSTPYDRYTVLFIA